MRKDALVFVVSNPVDILTQLAASRLGLPWSQVLGLGTMLDTARFRSLIAQELKLAPTQVKALIFCQSGTSAPPAAASGTKSTPTARSEATSAAGVAKSAPRTCAMGASKLNSARSTTPRAPPRW